MAGCATTNKPQTDAEYKQSITQATETLANKGGDEAVAQFQEIAQRNCRAANPGRTSPRSASMSRNTGKRSLPPTKR